MRHDSRMRHGSRKRSLRDPLQPVDAPTWLVVRNALSEVVESIPLARRADLRAILNAERDRRIADGWTADVIGPACGSFFCSRDGVRVLVAIEVCDPRHARPIS
jgi:hypothetical protein